MHVLPAAPGAAALRTARLHAAVHAEGGQAVVHRQLAEVAHAAQEGLLRAEGLLPRCRRQRWLLAYRPLQRRVQPQPRRLPPLSSGVPLAHGGASPLRCTAHLAPQPALLSSALMPQRRRAEEVRIGGGRIGGGRRLRLLRTLPLPLPRPRPLSRGGGGGARLGGGGALGLARRAGGTLLLELLLQRLRLLVVLWCEGGGGRYAQPRRREAGGGEAVGSDEPGALRAVLHEVGLDGDDPHMAHGLDVGHEPADEPLELRVEGLHDAPEGEGGLRRLGARRLRRLPLCRARVRRVSPTQGTEVAELVASEAEHHRLGVARGLDPEARAAAGARGHELLQREQRDRHRLLRHLVHSSRLEHRRRHVGCLALDMAGARHRDVARVAAAPGGALRRALQQLVAHERRLELVGALALELSLLGREDPQDGLALSVDDRVRHVQPQPLLRVRVRLPRVLEEPHPAALLRRLAAHWCADRALQRLLNLREGKRGTNAKTYELVL